MPEDKGKKSSSKKSSKELAAKAIYVTDKKDPRLKSYNDSLKLYKENLNQLKAEKRSEVPIKLIKRIPFNALPDNSYAEDFFERNDVYDKRSKKEVYPEKIKPIYFDINQIGVKTQHSAYYKKPVQPVILQKEKPEVKISPVKQDVPARDITPTGEVKLPTDASIKIERRGGKFAVDYFDVDEKSNLVPKTELFDTSDEADSFVKARKEGGKFYGPNITRRGATEDEAAKRVASKSSYSQYRKIGTGKEK